MGKQNWTEVEFADCVAMATNPVSANKKFAKRIRNMHSHIRPGVLVLRKGYGLKYAVPSNDRITNGSFLNFDMFWDRQALESGQEVTCLAQKGTIVALSGSGVADTQNMLCFWCRPYWDGSSWIDEWQWINETIITKITTATHATAKSMIIMYGATNQGIAENSLVGYTIYNKTKNQFAKIITNKVVDGDHTRINHTLFNSAWEVNDVLILSRSWLGLSYHEELYTLGWEDYAFHRILHDLRIGFGGQENRPGLAVGYRKNHLLANAINFTVMHADLTSAALEAFCKQDTVLLNTSFIDIKDLSYGMEITTVVSGTIPADTYYFKLIGRMDNYAEQLVSEGQIEVTGTQDIQLLPYMRLGKENRRITDFDLYYSDDNISFWKIKSFKLRDTEYNPTDWQINVAGKFILGGTSAELYLEYNAASRIQEYATLGSWEIAIGSYTTIAVAGPGVGAGGTSYSVKMTGLAFDYVGIMFPLTSLRKNVNYKVKFYVKSSVQTEIFVAFMGASGNVYAQPSVRVLSTVGFIEKDITVNTGDPGEDLAYIVFHTIGVVDVYIDHISITNVENFKLVPADLVQNTEMNSYLGYTSTYSVVKGWDQALSYRGRTYYLNPFVEKRYANFLLVSAIHSNNSFMYDIASFSNFREIASAESNKAIGMAKLDNGNFLILKDLSLMIIDPDTGVEIETIYGVSCISRNSIDNANGIIRFCGEEEIYYLNTSRGAIPILKNTIRDLYLAILDKDKIFGIRDKFNNYRIRINNPITKTEYLFTEEGPIEEKKELFAEIYRIDARGDLNFLNSGNIYLVEPDMFGYVLDDSGNWLLDDAGQTII